MADFPELQPSTRLYSPGRFPVETYRTYAGQETRVRRGSLAHGHRLDLTFQALTPDDAKSIRDHYVTQQGNFASFSLPSVVWTGVSSYATLLESGYRWIYNGPPQVNDESCGYQTVNVSLRAVYYYAVQGWTPGEYAGELTPTDPGDSWDTAVAGACEMEPEVPAQQLVVYFTALEAATTSELAPITLAENSEAYAYVWGTTEHFSQFAYAIIAGETPPGPFGYAAEWSIELSSFEIGIGNFTLEGWVRTNTNDFPSEETASIAINLSNIVILSVSAGKSETQIVRTCDLYIGEGSSSQVVSTDVEDTHQHVSMQRINGELIVHYAGEQVDIGVLSELLSETDLSIGGLILSAYAYPSVEGTSLGQVRLTLGQGLYGTGSFTPPSQPFYVSVG